MKVADFRGPQRLAVLEGSAEEHKEILNRFEGKEVLILPADTADLVADASALAVIAGRILDRAKNLPDLAREPLEDMAGQVATIAGHIRGVARQMAGDDKTKMETFA